MATEEALYDGCISIIRGERVREWVPGHAVKSLNAFCRSHGTFPLMAASRVPLCCSRASIRFSVIRSCYIISTRQRANNSLRARERQGV